MNYPQMMMTALYLQPQPQSILIIGLGGGSLPRVLTRMLPQAKIDIVEIDPAVVNVAKRYFDFRPSANLNVIEADGRVFIKRALREQRRYDLIMLDAFDHEYIPEHLLTQEFLREVKALLNPDGVLAANTFSSSRLYDHESTTYASVFGEFFNLRRENRVILAMTKPLPSPHQIAAESVKLQPQFADVGIDTQRVLPLLTTRRDWNQGRSRADRSVFAGEPVESLSIGRGPADMRDPAAADAGGMVRAHAAQSRRVSKPTSKPMPTATPMALQE